MNKTEFLNQIRQKTMDLAADEQARQISFYSEMLDDMTDNGMTEAEAVAELITDNFSAPVEGPGQTHGTAPIPACDRNESDHPGGKTLYISADSPDIRIETSMDGCPGVDYDPASWSLVIDDTDTECHMQISAIPTDQSDRTGLTGFLKKFAAAISDIPPVTIFLPEDAYDSAMIEIRSGDIDINYPFHDRLCVTGHTGDVLIRTALDIQLLNICSKSGDIDIQAPGMRCGTALLSATSGDISTAAQFCAGKLAVHTGSGDLDFSDVIAESAELYTGSGDIDISSLAASRAELQTGSGDIACGEGTIRGQLDVRTKNGDIDISGLSSQVSRIMSVSGDVEAALVRPAVCRLKSASGDIDAPAMQNGTDILEITTVSGDITVTHC